MGWWEEEALLSSGVPQCRRNDKQYDRAHSFHQPSRLTHGLCGTYMVSSYHVAVLSCPTDSTTSFFHTPTSLLLNHALITDVQQIAGRNGQQWINCTSGSRGMDRRGVQILSIGNSPIAGNEMNTARIGPERYPSNGLYYCLEVQAPRYYISLFLKNSSE